MDHASTLIQQPSVIPAAAPKSLYAMGKRTMDVFVALIGLCLSLLPMGAVWILIQMDSPGPALYCQERLGLDGKPFLMLKFRTMVPDAEKDGPRMTSKQDFRITRFGKFLRRTKIDELPQLVNVLKGEMSLVGPRPERACFYRQFEAQVPGFHQRLMVKPGITGWAQVHGGYDLSPEEKLQYDLTYIEKRSIRMDLHCLLLTILVILTGDGMR